MKGLYLLLDGLTLFFPFVLSFDQRVHYFSKWLSVFLATLIVALPFLVWDVLFTKNGVWGFNDDYLVGLKIAELPIEEILFFFVVPFACVFIYECAKFYLKTISFKQLNRIICFAIPLYGLLLALLEPVGWYTLSVVISSGFVLFFWLRNMHLNFAGITFLISLIPFLGVNGILTGGVTSAPVVWYNEAHKVSPRIWTIPMEDVLYCFTLIIGVILLYEYIHEKRRA
jgi:lycopene cyclase domain-containing protein